MASFSVAGLDGIVRSLSNLAGDTDRIAKEAIDAAKPVLRDALSQCIEEAADRGYATGELAGSIKATETKRDAQGYYAEVKATGTDKKGVRNSEKLAYLEHGTSRQVARPVMKKAIEQAREKCESIMQEKIEEAVQRSL